MTDPKKLKLSPREVLGWIRLGIVNGNYEATIGVIDDVLPQLPEDVVFATPENPEELARLRADSARLDWLAENFALPTALQDDSGDLMLTREFIDAYRASTIRATPEVLATSEGDNDP